ETIAPPVAPRKRGDVDSRRAALVAGQRALGGVLGICGGWRGRVRRTAAGSPRVAAPPKAGTEAGTLLPRSATRGQACARSPGRNEKRESSQLSSIRVLFVAGLAGFEPTTFGFGGQPLRSPSPDDYRTLADLTHAT